MKEGIDIHNYKRRIVKNEELIKKATISEKNKQLIFDFRDHCNVEGLSLARIDRYMQVLRDWAKHIGTDFDKATIAEITQAVRIVQEKDFSPWTKVTYKSMLKSFYRWLKKTGEDYSEEVKWIKARMKKSEMKLPGEGQLISEEEVRRLIENASHPRDKAFISVLYESGTRIGELASLQIMNVKKDKYGMLILVTGKTGSRPIRIISSAPYLSSWINMHPNRNVEEAPLWINLSTNYYGSQINYQGIRQMLKKLFKNAGINKRFNPHIFRHSRATFLANYLTEFQMNHYFGWTQGSDMASTYVHMSNKKIDESMLMLNGIEIKKEISDSVLKPKICPLCSTVNCADAKFCTGCGSVMDLKTSYDLESRNTEMRKNSDELLNVLFKDKEVLQIVMKKINELGLQDKVIV